MNRRGFLAGSAALTVGSIAGCVSGGRETRRFDGQDVPLVAAADAYGWHQDETARFVDARSRAAYEHSHVAGAVSSPEPDGLAANDPVAAWDHDTRIVTYCVCPHAMAGRRAASLLADGYEDVYALDEGFRHWIDEGYPIEGDVVEGRLPSYEIRGVSDPVYADEAVWVREPETNQREVSEVGADGTYELVIHFVDLTNDTVLRLEAPDYTVEATLAELTASVVTG